MPVQKLFAIKEFCLHHNVSNDFINELHHNEIIELITVKRTRFIAEKNLHTLEKIVRLHNDLQVNIEGIETILHLLASLEKKETEIYTLRNQLEFYTISASK
ncbi:MAG: chaperone modulator CbpM [Ferruginibacter sp.]